MAVPASLPQLTRSYAAPVPERSSENWAGLAGGVLDLIPHAVLIVSRDLRVLGANRKAREVMRSGGGLAWGASRREVVAATPEVTLELRRGVERASSGDFRRLLVPRPGRDPIALWLVRHPSDSIEPPGVVIFAVDPQQTALILDETLARRFGFTPAESAVARRLASGSNLDAIATALGVTLHTVRGHLKHVYSKAGVHRQAELVARLLSGA